MPDDNEPGQPGTADADAIAAAGDGGNIKSPVTREAQAALAAWTVEAMAEAEPYPMPEVSEAQLREQAEAVLDRAAGAGGIDAGGAPSGGTGTAAGDFQTLAGGYGYPAPFTRFEVPWPYTQYPQVTIGKVFFNQLDSQGQVRSYVASAASIGNSAILTAGHVVHSGNGKPDGWSTNLVFVPAYKDNVRPLGTWAASYLIARTAWYNNGNPNGLTEDIGGAVLRPLNGRKISQVVGFLGFAWNWPREQHWFECGYPAAPPFNGQRMNMVAASYGYNGAVPGVPPVATGSDMTGGCSGGPWIRGMFSSNLANGVNSYRQTNRPLEMNSPYFDDRAKSIKDSLVAGTP